MSVEMYETHFSLQPPESSRNGANHIVVIPFKTPAPEAVKDALPTCGKASVKDPKVITGEGSGFRGGPRLAGWVRGRPRSL